MLRRVLSRLGLIRNKLAAPPPKPPPALPKVNRMATLAEWRQNGERVKAMRIFLASDFGQDMLGVLINEAGVRANMPDPDAVRVGLELGRIAGHQECLQIMTLMAELWEPPQEPRISYRTPAILRNPHHNEDEDW